MKMLIWFGFCLKPKSLEFFIIGDNNMINSTEAGPIPIGILEGSRPSFIIFLVGIVSFYFLHKRYNSKGMKTGEDVPVVKYFSFWFPESIEALTTTYKMYRDGVRAFDSMWHSVNCSPLFKVPLPLGKNFVAVMDPDLIQKCMNFSDQRFLHKPRFVYDIVFTDLLKDGLIASDLKVWEPHRKVLNKYFNYKSLPSQLKVINKYCQVLLNDLDKLESAEIPEMHFGPILYGQILNIILEVMYGAKIMDEKGVEKVPEKFRETKNLVLYRFFNPHNLIPIVWKFNPKRKQYLSAIKYLEDYIDGGIDKTKADLKQKMEDEDGSENMTCVEHMLQNNMPDKEIRDEVAMQIVAGHETTDTTLHFLIQHLGEHPEIQKRCQEEVDLLFNSKSEDDTEVTLDDLKNLKYMEQCIQETLRLTPTIPVVARELQEKVELGDALLDKGTILLFCPWALHRHPDYYPAAEKFDPDRFTVENAKARHAHAYIPFSHGPRNCIGWKIGMMEMKTTMFWLLRNYTIYTKDKLADIKLIFDITLLPERRFDFVLKKRDAQQMK